MLFLSIGTYKPDKRDAIVKRMAEKGLMFPEGVKLIGQWTDVGGGRVFTMSETDDPIAMALAAYNWTDLCEFEVVPLIVTEEGMKAIS